MRPRAKQEHTCRLSSGQLCGVSPGNTRALINDYSPISQMNLIFAAIQLQGKSFTIAGYNTRARKSPINITDSSGRGYKCSVAMVKMYNS